MLKKTSFAILIAFALTSQGFAQQAGHKDSIEIVKDFWTGMKFYRDDKKLTMGQLSNIMRPDADAFNYLNKARTNNTIAFISGFIGGFLIGYELGSLLGGNDINWGVMGAGAGFILVAIPFDTGFKRNARKAVNLYNAALR